MPNNRSSHNQESCRGSVKIFHVNSTRVYYFTLNRITEFTARAINIIPRIFSRNVKNRTEHSHTDGAHRREDFPAWMKRIQGIKFYMRTAVIRARYESCYWIEYHCGEEKGAFIPGGEIISRGDELKGYIPLTKSRKLIYYRDILLEHCGVS